MDTAYDASSGYPAGAAFVQQAIHPENQTRSDARRAYYDPVSSRPNLHVLVNSAVTRIIVEQISNPCPVRPPLGVGWNAAPATKCTGPVGYAPLQSSQCSPLVHADEADKNERDDAQHSHFKLRKSKRDPQPNRRITGVEVSSSAVLVAIRL